MPYLRQRSLIGIPTSASFKIATIWLSVFRLLIVKLLSFSLKEILRVICIILRGSYKNFLSFGFIKRYVLIFKHFCHLIDPWLVVGVRLHNARICGWFGAQRKTSPATCAC